MVEEVHQEGARCENFAQPQIPLQNQKGKNQSKKGGVKNFTERVG